MVATLNKWRHRPGFKLGASASAKSSNAAAQRGIAYHRRVYRKLEAAAIEGAELLVEPWFEEIDHTTKPAMCSPDTVLRYPDGSALVIEVKMNWQAGRDDKLLQRYLPVVRSAFNLDVVWPLLIAGSLRNYPGTALLGLPQLEQALAWEPGDSCPVMLLP